MTDLTLPVGRRRAAFAFIFVTVMLDMLALGMIIPVLPKLIVTFMSGDTAASARIVGLFGTAWALMQFLFSPVLGSLSDRFGRRPVVLLSNLGLGLDYLVMAVAPTLGWLFVGRVISGITSASIATAGAYIADVLPAEKRAGAFGMLGVAFGIGFVLGPAAGGLLGSVSPRLPFWVAGALSLTNALYGLLILPESLPLERRRAFSWKRANPVGAMQLLRRHGELLGLAAVHFLYHLAYLCLPAVFVLYAMYRYGWDERTVGFTLAGVGIGSMIVQGGLVRPVVARFGERRTLLAGLLCGAAGMVVFALAARGGYFWMGVPIMALYGLANPANQALMSRRVGGMEQGELQGALSSVAGTAGLLGPGLFSLIFAAFIAPGTPIHLPGAAFLLAALLLIAATTLAMRVTKER